MTVKEYALLKNKARFELRTAKYPWADYLWIKKFFISETGVVPILVVLMGVSDHRRSSYNTGKATETFYL